MTAVGAGVSVGASVSDGRIGAGVFVIGIAVSTRGVAGTVGVLPSPQPSVARANKMTSCLTNGL